MVHIHTLVDKKTANSPFLDASGNKNIGATIRIGQEILCLPYAGFLNTKKGNQVDWNININEYINL